MYPVGLVELYGVNPKAPVICEEVNPVKLAPEPLNAVAMRFPDESLNAKLDGTAETLPEPDADMFPNAVSIASKLVIVEGAALWSITKLRFGERGGILETLVVTVPGFVRNCSGIEMSPDINSYI